MRLLRVRSFWPYLLAPGALSWAALFSSGIHPAFALVPVLPFLPHAARDPGFFVDADPDAKDTLDCFERWSHLPAQAALLLFGLVNGGIQLRALEMGTLALPLAVVIGRPIGVFAAVTAAVAAGFHLPGRAGWRELLVIACASAAGFSLTLFLVSGLFAPGQLLAEMKMGAMLTLVAVPLAFAVARLLGAGRYAGPRRRGAPRVTNVHSVSITG